MKAYFKLFLNQVLKSSLYIVACITTLILLSSPLYADSGKDFLSKEEQEWLAKNQSQITLAVETGYAPFVFIDSKDCPAGLAHDYMLLLESKLGVRFKEKRFPTLNEIFDKLKSGEVQIVNAVTNTPARSKFIKFSDPFITVPNVIIVQNNRTGPFKEETLHGLRVSLVKGYAVTEDFINKGLNFTPELVPDDITALYNVSSGLTDAAIIDLATASYLISTKGITNLRIAGETTFAIRLAMGTAIAEPTLNSIIQKGLAQITDAERKEIRSRWINASRGNIFADWRFWAVVISAIFALCAAIFGNILWNRALRSQVALRTEELTRETAALQKLKEELQVQNEELAVIEEELRIQNDQLMATEEELRSQNDQLMATEEKLRLQVCEQENSRKLLYDSEERYRLIMESVAVIPWEFNIPENRWTYVGPQVAELLGYAPEEWTTLEWWLGIIHPEDQVWVPAYCADLTSRGEEHSMEYRLMAKDGTIVWVNELVTVEMLDGKPGLMRGIMIDITERKRVEIMLRNERKRINSILNTVSDPIFLKGNDHRILLANPAFYDMFGLDENAVIGKTLAENVPANEQQQFLAVDRMVLDSGIPDEREETLTVRDFTRTIVTRKTRFFEASGERFLVGSIHDITERKKFEQELQNKNSELERFTYTVSHDLKSPLVTIQCYSGMILSDMLAGNLQQAEVDLKRIEGAATKMTELLDDLLELSRVGKSMNSREKIDMNSLVREVLLGLEGSLCQQQIELVISSDLPEINGDWKRIEEVMQNLVENAIKYMGGQSAPRIEIGLREENNERVFFVLDNGIGIDPRYQEKIFDLFNKLDPKSEGTGVGLALVKRIIENHGGRIWVESEGEGLGSRFCFTVGK